MQGITERGATRWVFIRIHSARTAANARRFVRDPERACPMRIRTDLTDNGKEVTYRLFGMRNAAPVASTSSTNSAPNLASNTDWPRRSVRKPTASLWVIAGNHLPGNASMAGSRSCCKASISIPARIWKPRCIAMCCSTISNFPNQPWPCRR